MYWVVDTSAEFGCFTDQHNSFILIGFFRGFSRSFSDEAEKASFLGRGYRHVQWNNSFIHIKGLFSVCVDLLAR